MFASCSYSASCVKNSGDISRFLGKAGKGIPLKVSGKSLAAA